MWVPQCGSAACCPLHHLPNIPRDVWLPAADLQRERSKPPVLTWSPAASIPPVFQHPIIRRVFSTHTGIISLCTVYVKGSTLRAALLPQTGKSFQDG